VLFVVGKEEPHHLALYRTGLTQHLPHRTIFQIIIFQPQVLHLGEVPEIQTEHLFPALVSRGFV
jgi:hypothetical protein